MRVFANLAQLAAEVGREVAVSDWIVIEQPRIQQFADATGDQQWIHTDPERAQAGPFGAPIAHGFLTLSLLPYFIESSMRVDSVKMGVNYGLEKVRFMTPVRVGSRLRARFKLMEAKPIDQASAAGTQKGLQMLWEVTTEIEGQTKPACVALSVVRQFE
jgi:acyl dehydratase